MTLHKSSIPFLNTVCIVHQETWKHWEPRVVPGPLQIHQFRFSAVTPIYNCAWNTGSWPLNADIKMQMIAVAVERRHLQVATENQQGSYTSMCRSPNFKFKWFTINCRLADLWWMWFQLAYLIHSHYSFLRNFHMVCKWRKNSTGIWRLVVMLLFKRVNGKKP